MREKEIAELLLKTFGGVFSEALGIDLKGSKPAEIFKWFLASKLFGARISTDIAMRTYREFEKRAVIGAKEMLASGWDALVEILDGGGYVRYDFSTATRLLDIAKRCESVYGCNLNNLHRKAKDGKELATLLKGLGKGVGDVTANIFLRELRGIWEKAEPEPSALVALAAEHLGIIKGRRSALKELKDFWKAAGIKGHDFRDFEAALLKLGKDYCKKGKARECPMKPYCKG
jgi:endonuclease III